MNRSLYCRTAPCYYSMQLNNFLSAFVLDNGYNFNFLSHVLGWSISRAKVILSKSNSNHSKFRP